MAEEIKEPVPAPEGTQTQTTENTSKAEVPKAKQQEPSKSEGTRNVEQPKEDNSKQIEELQNQIKDLEIQNVGLMVALESGLDSHNAEAVLKLADLSAVYDKNGKLNKNSLKIAINKVLVDYPVFKPQNNQPSGIVIGGSGSNVPAPQVQGKQEKPIAQKRWNRFNN